MTFAKHDNFESFFAALLPEEQAVVTRLRTLILEHFPRWREKMSYGVPYYFGRRRICFIWPASVPPSGLAAGVCLGFAQGYRLADPCGLLDMGGRKEVGMIVFLHEKDVREGAVLELLEAAGQTDEAFWGVRNTRNRG